MTPADRSARPSWHDRRLSRRGFLAGTAATVSAGALVGRVPAVVACRGRRLRLARCRAPGNVPDEQEPAGGRPVRDDVQAVAGVRAERPAADEPGPDHGRGPDGARRQPSEHQPGSVRRVHVHRAVHRPRHHAGHHAAESAACGPRRDRQLPNGALRPRFGLSRRAGERSGLLRPGRPGQAAVAAERQRCRGCAP